MNITSIAVFMFAVLLSVGAVDSAGLFGGTPVGYDVSDLNSTASAMTGTSGYQIAGSATAAQAGILGTLWYIVQGFTILLKALYIALFTGPYLMQLIPWLPGSFVFVLQAVIYVVYGIGIIQFLTGRSEKMMR
jgi:hypothetical protein